MKNIISKTILLVKSKTVTTMINQKIRVMTKYLINKLWLKILSLKLKERLCWIGLKRKSKLNKFNNQNKQSRFLKLNKIYPKLLLFSKKNKIKFILIKTKRVLNKIGNKNKSFKMKLNKLILIIIMKKMRIQKIQISRI